MSQPTRPVLRYHGGKWMIAPWIIGHFPPHRIYVEPYGGAASVLMRKPRSHAEVYNDLDDDVVHVFRVLRDPELATRLREACRLTPFARTEFWGCYDEPTDDPIERARRIIARCFMGHGGTSRRKNRTGFRAKCYRQNSTGARDWAGWPDQVARYVERLRAVTIECRPALQVIAQQDTPHSLFYVDPPYPLSVRSSIRWPSEADRAYAHDLTDDDHRELAETLHQVQGAVVISSYASDLYEDLYRGWRRVEKATLGDGAVKRTEVLWISPRADELRGQRSLFA